MGLGVNQSYRLVGFFGDPDLVGLEFERLPYLDKKSFKQGMVIYRYWVETPLAPEDDEMFEL